MKGTKMAQYTYTIYDHNPNECGDCAWPSHDGVAIEADSTAAAIDDVLDALSVAAGDLYASDGYEPGQTLHAKIWDEDDSCVGRTTYQITAEDLGEHEVAS